jgi:large subunit ribosomal protein L13
MKTFRSFQQKKEAVQREWHLIDAQGKVLGRLAAEIAQILSGKQKVTYTSHVDGGDFVVVINAETVTVTGAKETQKMYYRHSQYPGGLKQTALRDVRKEQPKRMIEEAVWGMLPKNKLRDIRMKRLKVMAGATHPYSTHFAQKSE